MEFHIAPFILQITYKMISITMQINNSIIDITNLKTKSQFQIKIKTKNNEK